MFMWLQRTVDATVKLVSVMQHHTVLSVCKIAVPYNTAVSYVLMCIAVGFNVLGQAFFCEPLTSWHHEEQDETVAHQSADTLCHCSGSHSGLSCSCPSRYPLRSDRRLPQLGAAATAEEGFQAQGRGQPAPHHHRCTALLVIWPGWPGCELLRQSTVFLALLCWYVLLSLGLLLAQQHDCIICRQA